MMLATFLTLALGFWAPAQAPTAAAAPEDLLPSASFDKLKAITLSSSNKVSTLDPRVMKTLGMGKDGTPSP